jgi:hypothetical protein
MLGSASSLAAGAAAGVTVLKPEDDGAADGACEATDAGAAGGVACRGAGAEDASGAGTRISPICVPSKLWGASSTGVSQIQEMLFYLWSGRW